eukprot:CAMPEP_0176288764 /NCGR_PEP_ID=MMETSP0121_2-20121125/54145_1 /TAXON_ID=160619 /ORGANISM="Kryptoperidinium foliaceum, Strain CCMP 1326" /LENGTH=82 /DNA_ID=CAMNT_0017629473 /DNA_START=11 /DNA_END=256 /DNA_ORIENTATION=-
MAVEEATEFYHIAESAEKFDLTVQDCPPLSNKQLMDILHARLREEGGFSIEDLPVDHLAEFNQALSELGFSSAMERMAVRRA